MVADAGNTDAYIDEREAETLGKPLRILPLGVDEFDDEMTAFIAQIRASYGNNPDSPVPMLYRTLFRHLGLFQRQMATIGFLLTQGELDPRERELMILRILWLCGSPNPYGEHVVAAKLLDVTQEEVDRVIEGSGAPGWTEHERAMLGAVEQLHVNKLVSDDTWAVLAKSWSQKQQVEFAVLVGQYTASAILHNTLRTRPSDYNKGLRTRID